jgi:hypothetical protein
MNETHMSENKEIIIVGAGINGFVTGTPGYMCSQQLLRKNEQ